MFLINMLLFSITLQALPVHGSNLRHGFDHEAASNHDITVQVTDNGGLTYSESFTITVGDTNNKPVAIDDYAAVFLEEIEAFSILFEADFSGDWANSWPVTRLSDTSNTESVDVSGEAWLRVNYAEGTFGGPRDGLSFYAEFEPRDRMYLEYQLRFAPDFDWVRGGKLPGLNGGHVSAGSQPDGTDGWSVLFMWREDGLGEAYVYYPDKTNKWGQSFSLGNFQFQAGVIHTLGLEVVMNTPGISGGQGERDGIIRAWLDGDLVVEETAIRFRDIPELQMDVMHFVTFFGGNDSSWATTKDEYIDFGNFTRYTAPPAGARPKAPQ